MAIAQPAPMLDFPCITRVSMGSAASMASVSIAPGAKARSRRAARTTPCLTFPGWWGIFAENAAVRAGTRHAKATNMRLTSLPLYAYEIGAGSFAIAALVGCTTLGPMPAVTGASVATEDRPNAELQAGAVPGFYLSSSVTDEPRGSPVSQAAAFLEPDDLISLPGLGVGARYVGKAEEGGYIEPMVRYRTNVGKEKRIGVGAVGFGTHSSGSDRGASYEATRAGAEASVDIRVNDRNHWAEVHAYAGASATGLFADGKYCQNDQTGYAVDCPTDDFGNLVQNGDMKAELSGVFPTAFTGVSVDFARHLESVFHGIRVGTYVAGGLMPTYKNADRKNDKIYTAIGLALTVGLGAVEREDGTGPDR